MDTVTRVQILDETDCISHSTNTLGKGMNPIILPPAMGKQQDRLGSSALMRHLVQEKENSEFKPVKLRLKIDLVSYPTRAEGLVNIIMTFNSPNLPTRLEIGYVMVRMEKYTPNPLRCYNCLEFGPQESARSPICKQCGQDASDQAEDKCK